MKVLRDCRGFTFVETLVYAAVLGFAGSFMAHLIKTDLPVRNLMLTTSMEDQLTRSLNIFISELHEADPSQITATATSISFNIVTYDFTQSPAAVTTKTIQYAFVPGATTGSFTRTEDAGPAKVLLANVDAPTDDNPLLQFDATNPKILILNLSYHPEGVTPMKVLRRVTLPG